MYIYIRIINKYTYATSIIITISIMSSQTHEWPMESVTCHLHPQDKVRQLEFCDCESTAVGYVPFMCINMYIYTVYIYIYLHLYISTYIYISFPTATGFSRINSKLIPRLARWLHCRPPSREPNWNQSGARRTKNHGSHGVFGI